MQLSCSKRIVSAISQILFPGNGLILGPNIVITHEPLDVNQIVNSEEYVYGIHGALTWYESIHCPFYWSEFKKLKMVGFVPRDEIYRLWNELLCVCDIRREQNVTIV